MRFRAKLNLPQVQLLLNLISPISRLSGSGTSSTKININSSLHLNQSNLNMSHDNIGYSIGNGGSIIHLSEEHFRISTRGKVGSDSDGVICFAELHASGGNRNGIFLEHRIESIADNTIVFEIDLVQFKMALQSILEGGAEAFSAARSKTVPSLQSQNERNDPAGSGSADRNNAEFAIPNPSVIIMKLAKRNNIPCLCLDSAKGFLELHHAIPIRIMRSEDMHYHLPPQISMPDVQLELPQDRPIKPVIERLKTLSPQVYIEGSMAGDLTFRIDGDGASIRTFYSKLIPRFEDCKQSSSVSSSQSQNCDSNDERGHMKATQRNNDSDEEQELNTCVLKIDSKKLNTCLQWQNNMSIGRGMAQTAVLCMVENEMLVLHILLNPGNIGFFTYYVPVHYLSNDEADL